MTFTEIKNHLKRLLTLKTKPVCFSDNKFMYCYCGKCKPKYFELPSDFQRILAINITKQFLTQKAKNKEK